MKRIQSLVQGLIACGVAMALVTNATAQNVTQGKAKIIRIKGAARYTTGNNVWQPLKVGDVLKAGAVIQTDTVRGSFVDLVLGDGSGRVPAAMSTANPAAAPPPTPASYFQPKSEQNFVRIWENSALGIDKMTSMETGSDVITDTQLDLKAGHIFGSVKKMSAASKYEVKIPNGVAGIRGTTYDISAEGVVKVSDGSVVVAWVGADGTVTTQVVNAGQQFDARTGQITPLSADTIRFMQTILSDARTQAGAPGVHFGNVPNVDQTIIFVTPPGVMSNSGP